MNSILGIIRHILTTAGGSLVTGGIMTNGDLETTVGAVVTLIGIGWSVWDKKRNAKP